MDLFQTCHDWATALYAQEHPEVYDPRLPDWERQHHLDECQRLEDEMISAELLANYGVDEMNAQWEKEYNDQIAEEIEGVDEAVREYGHYPLEPAYDASRPDRESKREREEFLEQAQRLIDDLTVWDDNYGVDEMNTQWEGEYNAQIAKEVEDEDRDIRDNGYCPEYDPSLDNDEPADLSLDWRVAMSC